VLLAFGLGVAAPSLPALAAPGAVTISAHVEQALLPGRVETPRTHQTPVPLATAAMVLPAPTWRRAPVTRVVGCAPCTAVSGPSSRGPPGT
jgi:hypothetical protein